jgi:Skp family chaperone for outer membrane proteins
VKRTVIILAGVAALGLAVYVANHAGAQQGNNQPARPPLQTRVALLNLGQCIKNYNKFKSFEESLKKQSDYYQKLFEEKKAQAVAKQEQQKKPETTPAQREELDRDLRTLQHQMQDLAEEVKQKLGKQEFDLMVMMYKEVQDAASIYARTYGFELVLQYNDAVGADAYSAQVFQRKLANGACMPLYNDDRMDITRDVTAMLNQKLASSAAAPTN